MFVRKIRLKPKRKQQQIKCKLRLGCSKATKRTKQNKIVLELIDQLIKLFAIKIKKSENISNGSNVKNSKINR